MMCFDQRFKYGNQCIDDVIEFENPNEADFRSSSKDLIIRDFSLFTGLVQFLVCAQFHDVVILRNE